MKFILSVLAVLFSFASYAQYAVTGKVVDASTNMPLPSASVFAQNTTFGTVTDAGGNFRLSLPAGGYDLAVTYTGYNTDVRRISTADTSGRSITIQLKHRDESLEAVSIVSNGEVQDGWERYGLFFTDNFVGKTALSANARLLNKDALKFFFSKKKNRLKVTADAPLEIQNDALGYKIKYAIDSFTYNYGTQTTYFTGYPLFEEMQPLSDSQRLAWSYNRMKAYKGSMLHFMKSVYSRTLREEGFDIQFIVKNSSGMDTAIAVKDYYGALNYDKDDSTGSVEMRPNQPEIAVLYNLPPENGYLAENDEAPKDYQLSFITIAPGVPITIEQNGYYYDQTDITIDGYWTWQKVGDMLPYDYKP